MVNFPEQYNTSPKARERFELDVENAKKVIREREGPVRDVDWFKRFTFVPSEPVFIGGSEYIGTARARANHVDACIHFCEEQVALKTLKHPIV